MFVGICPFTKRIVSSKSAFRLKQFLFEDLFTGKFEQGPDNIAGPVGLFVDLGKQFFFISEYPCLRFLP